MVAEVEVERLRNTLPKVEAVYAQAHKPAEVKFETLGDSLGNMESDALVNTLPERLEEVEVETLCKRLLRRRPRR